MGMSLIVRAAFVLAAAAPIASAQVFTVDGREERRQDGARSSPVFGGAGIIYGRPTGEFGEYVKQGFGVDGAGRWKVDRQGIFNYAYLRRIMDHSPHPRMRWHYNFLWVAVGLAIWEKMFLDPTFDGKDFSMERFY